MQYFGGERPPLAEICHEHFIAIFRKSLFDNKVLFFPTLSLSTKISHSAVPISKLKSSLEELWELLIRSHLARVEQHPELDYCQSG